MTPPTSARVIALDLDGTLLDGTGVAHGASGRRRARRRRRGSPRRDRHGPTTRHRGAGRRGRSSGLVSHIVGGNGTIISTFPSDPDESPELIHVSGFEHAAAAEIVAVLRRQDRTYAFALATDRGFVHEPGFAELMPAAVHDDPVDDVLALGGSTAFKLLVFHADRPLAALLQEIPPLIAHLDTGFAVRHMGAEAAEIGPADDDKGAGLRWLCTHLGVDAADVIAVGDEQNDLTMLEWAGHGVAVANADPGVRAAADETIGSNLDEGVARFLEGLVGGAGTCAPRQDDVKTP